MQQPIVPHLCGGIFFALVLQAIKPRRKTRDRLKGGTDKLSNKDVFAGLTKVLTGETLQVVGETLDKCVSLFKSCQDNGGTYVPFTNPVVVSSFDVAVKEKNPDKAEELAHQHMINAYDNMVDHGLLEMYE